MRVPIALQGALLALLTAGSFQAAGSDHRGNSDKARGADVFNHWCAPCHAPGPYHPGTQALDAKYMGTLPGALEERRDLAPGLIKTYVRRGVSIMPFFRKTEINDTDLQALSDYLAKASEARH